MAEVQAPQQIPETQRSTALIDVIDRLSRFDGPPDQFLVHLLAVQCQIASAEGGAILRVAAEGRVEILSVFPPPPQGAAPPVWLSQSAELAEQVITSGRTAVRPIHSSEDLYGAPARRYLVLVPLLGGGGVRGMSAYALTSRDAGSMALSRERLEITCSLLSLYEMRLTLQHRQFDLRRLRLAMETLARVNEQNRFTAAGMALCNEVAARWQCERVSLGFLKERYVHIKAMSHTEKFNRKMKLVQDIEAAMEECLDQDVEIIYPSSPEMTYVARMAGDLSTRHGPASIVSMPLRRGGDAVGVLTVERRADKPFAAEEIESLRLACELCTGWVVNLHEQDKWFGAKAAGAIRKGAAAAVGPKHTWIKLLAIGGFALVLFLVFAKSDYQAEAPFTVEAIQKQVIPSPFEGNLKTVLVDPGQAVKAGEVIATLRTDDLENQLARSQAEMEDYTKQSARALAEDKLGEKAQADANVNRIKAEIALITERIAKASITSPMDGIILRGDLKRQIGAPMKMGDVMFEIAPLDSLRAELSVPEDQIVEVRVGQTGEMAHPSFPGEKISFTVERINPVAEVVEQTNVFKVRVQLSSRPTWLSPGMEGVAKVNLDRRSYGFLWTHRLVNWARMKLWL